MAIPTDLVARGCSAHLAQPVGEGGLQEADFLVEMMLAYNDGNVVFRSSYNEEDILRHVFRWTDQPPEQIFINGFRAQDQGNTTDDRYWNIQEYVNNGGAPLEPHQSVYGFISTTLNSGWIPQTTSFAGRIVYRYEIFAPGGIWVAQTLANYRYPSQDEVIFVRGVNRQYIRSAQRFRLVNNGGHVTRERVDQELIINPYIDPASHPTRRLLNLQNPVDYCVINRRRVELNVTYVDPEPSSSSVSLRSIRSTNNNLVNPNAKVIWYGKQVSDVDGYLSAGFKAYATNEVYLFMRNSYVLVNYAPGSTGDYVINGPLLISDGFHSLRNTAFAHYGIKCSFASHRTKEAYIFSGKLCARINYAPGSTNDYIITGPLTIAKMFPFFKGTGFENGVDAAFESSATYEAYIFKGNQYALINYNTPRLIGGPKKITDGFYSLRNTIFETGIEAAFASHIKNEAYLFKGDQYALINFAPGGTNDYIIGGPKKITPNWPSLASFLPFKNHGIDG